MSIEEDRIMGIKRCNSVNAAGVTSQPVTLSRSLSSLDGNVERYIQQNIIDAEANMTQFEKEFGKDQLPPGVNVLLDEDSEVKQCSALDILLDESYPTIQKLQLAVKTLEQIAGNLEFSTTSTTNDQQQLIRRTIQDLRGVLCALQEENVNKAASRNHVSSQPMSGKDILARAHLIKTFLAKLEANNGWMVLE